MKNSGKAFSTENIDKINKIIKRAAALIKQEGENKSYMKHILKELLPIILLKLLHEKCTLKINKEELKILVSEKMIKQLQVKGFK